MVLAAIEKGEWLVATCDDEDDTNLDEQLQDAGKEMQ
jgi:hypothetical protein